ncbi:hypothetical protein C2G38_2081117 [Gigaspora rosea]|uniref:Uncharacterized protein n=1 Tax=Gigaspora rosea TaxID=44941 RepID=A0A397VER6_9GLOM|nr:hypothetical protein C2G38_2081117 [Gigaspora rosea]
MQTPSKCTFYLFFTMVPRACTWEVRLYVAFSYMYFGCFNGNYIIMRILFELNHLNIYYKTHLWWFCTYYMFYYVFFF